MNMQEIRQAIQDEVVKLIHKTDARGCRVIREATQSINDTSLTALSFDTQISDSDACWAVGDPTKLYAPLDGYYLAGGSVEIAAAQVSAAARLAIYVRANGSTYLGENDVHLISGKTGAAGVCTGQFWLAAGEYVELIVYHDIGSAKNVSAATTTSQHKNNGWLMRVG